MQASSSLKSDLLQQVNEHETRLNNLSERMVDLLRVADIMQYMRSDNWPENGSPPEFIALEALLEDHREKVGHLEDSSGRSYMVRAKIVDLELATREAIMMTCEIGDVLALDTEVDDLTSAYYFPPPTDSESPRPYSSGHGSG